MNHVSTETQKIERVRNSHTLIQFKTGILIAPAMCVGRLWLSPSREYGHLRKQVFFLNVSYILVMFI